MPIVQVIKSKKNLIIEWVKKRGSKNFEYHLPIEITNKQGLPQTWKNQLF